MRKFARKEEPEILKDNQHKWTSQWTELLLKNPKATFKWYTVDNLSARDHLLPFLTEQTSAHCSFCDAFPIAGVSCESIEHFRPKCRERFPELAYAWINLYYCCSACQSAKGDVWDDLLLHADHDEYTFDRYFEYDFTTGEIRPNSVASHPDQHRATLTIKLYGLDRQDRRRNRLLELRKRSNQKEQEPIADQEWAYRDFLGL